ncbi:type I glyceraldehyde-3-phosphate dehydrogenase [Patescibacteria group bacterium]|nr:type I glyceraldehyde-3-phosphate dehydrogenase [Patescibacteria group bacterium]
MVRTIGINGFGRIGRAFFRYVFDKPDMRVVAINDLSDAESLGYLLKYDTVYGTAPFPVRVQNGVLFAGDRSTKITAIRDAAAIPWKELGVDVVIEATGFYDSFEKASVHRTGGARRVVITAPAKDAGTYRDGATVLMGVNEASYAPSFVTSNGSCTTNAGAPLLAILDEALGVENALLSTTHAYTASQALVDGMTKGHNRREYRAGAQNLVPTSTGAALAVVQALPAFNARFDGISIRAPVACGSLVDVTFVAKRSTSVEEVNAILRTAAADHRYQGVFTATDEELVSSDIVGMPYGAIADLQLTRVVGGTLVKVCAWYDNEWGYVSTLYRHVIRTCA